MFRLELIDESMRRASGVDVTYWAIDSDKNTTLHQKLKYWQSFEYGDCSAIFVLKVAGCTFEYKLEPASNSPVSQVNGRPEYIWDKLTLERSEVMPGYEGVDPIPILKEALLAYGGGWMENQANPDFDVTFNF